MANTMLKKSQRSVKETLSVDMLLKIPTRKMIQIFALLIRKFPWFCAGILLLTQTVVPKK